MIEFRIKYAVTYLDDAKFLFIHKRYNSAISRLYYASYQTMWAALGDPEGGRTWKHLGIIKPFVHGYWFKPAYPEKSQGLLEHFRLPLRQLYTYRIKADYELLDINENVAKNMLDTVDNLMKTVLSKGEDT
ncbi:MAG: HEPN domain-containing protein [Nitrospinae bacterium]|nr:HEPN domain-containing protein [Nitrospinota bacterium]MBI3814128.1 HEPN domain-containing protein [Nitrospinota bacterium]